MTIRRAFTLVEILMVVAIMAIVAGMVVFSLGSIGRQSDENMLRAELSEIRNAVIRFHTDMGQSPQRLAELIQPPDQWWWRTTNVSDALQCYDPVTRRGWNGPYIQDDMIGSSATIVTNEWKLVRNAGTGELEYSRADSSGGYLAIVRSSYNNFPQQLLGEANYVSNYQLDATDPGDLAIRFVQFIHETDPSDPDNATEIGRVSTGVAP